MNFLKLRNLQNIQWPQPNQLALTCNLKLTIFKIKLAFYQQYRKKIIKQEHSAFIVACFSIYILCVALNDVNWPAHSFQFMEWQNLGIRNTKASYMCPKCFLKIFGKPNNYHFYFPNFLKFCNNISHKLLRPSHSLEKFLEILKWFALQKQIRPLPLLLNVAASSKSWSR